MKNKNLWVIGEDIFNREIIEFYKTKDKCVFSIVGSKAKYVKLSKFIARNKLTRELISFSFDSDGFGDDVFSLSTKVEVIESEGYIDELNKTLISSKKEKRKHNQIIITPSMLCGEIKYREDFLWHDHIPIDWMPISSSLYSSLYSSYQPLFPSVVHISGS